jgi:hypothetical protein
MKTNSKKIITLAAKKIMLQKKILKYQEMIKDIDEAIEDDINYNLILKILSYYLKN